MSPYDYISSSKDSTGNQIVEGKEHWEDFFFLYRLWEYYQQRQEEMNKQGNGLDEDAQIRNRQPDSKDLSTDNPVENKEIQSQVRSLPDESNAEQKVNSRGNVIPTKANPINEILVWLEMPKKRGGGGTLKEFHLY
ncbi:hypothetical protein L798_06182 [Zootermopsis nevadensis]|uniref:Uncharacterized protein n=1 Tax=Zootermopsis nevadensis TaxID=136037 RepID=A0A067RH61_ZOONE|nr:hypothetical protein L798_06182 [Zootermopsis nevadensis]